MGFSARAGGSSGRVLGVAGAAMVAAKVASTAPNRVDSLTLLGYTTNGWQMAASLVSSPVRLAKVRRGSTPALSCIRSDAYHDGGATPAPMPRPVAG